MSPDTHPPHSQGRGRRWGRRWPWWRTPATRPPRWSCHHRSPGRWCSAWSHRRPGTSHHQALAWWQPRSRILNTNSILLFSFPFPTIQFNFYHHLEKFPPEPQLCRPTPRWSRPRPAGSHTRKGCPGWPGASPSSACCRRLLPTAPPWPGTPQRWNTPDV